MAELAGTRILKDLVNSGKISFDETDLKKEKNQSRRKLLYQLGAYKGTQICQYDLEVFGITGCKRMIDAKISINLYNHIHLNMWDSYQAFNKIIGIDALKALDEFVEIHSYIPTDQLRKLKTWKKIKRGKDVFIRGLGSFDIDKAYKIAVEHSRNIYSDETDAIFSVTDLRLAGYFPEEENTYGLEKLYKDSIEMFKWVYINKFPVARIDELMDLNILGLFDITLNKKSILKRLDDINIRNLRLTWVDTSDFDYPDYVIELARLLEFTVPKNGIDLKKQARLFKNCSGGYVRKILDKQSFIIYNDNEMIEIGNHEVYQHFGRMNGYISNRRKNRVQNLLERC